MANEIDELVANITFTVCGLPPGRKAISERWVFQWKCSEYGEVTRAKCRLVARGFLQQEDVDFNEVYSPTPRVTWIRLLARVVIKDDQPLHYIDI